MSYIGNDEKLIELPTIEYFQKNLGYKFINSEKLTPEMGERNSYEDVILDKRLENALYRLNPWMNESDIFKTSRYLRHKEEKGQTVLSINHKMHNALVNSEFIIEKADNDGLRRLHKVCFIDWENIENNDFLVTSKFKVQGMNESIVADIVIFINGIPVVVLECKSGLAQNEDENILKQQGYEKLDSYIDRFKIVRKEGIEKLFYTNFFVGLLTENNNYIGTIGSTLSKYMQWSDCYPFTKLELDNLGDCPNKLALHGLFYKKNILNIMSNFIVFEASNNSISKRLCRYYQYRSVEKAIQHLIENHRGKNLGGFIHHTHGSGRIMTMVYLINKIRKNNRLRDNSILIVTDRTDLSNQIHDIFSRTGIDLPIQYAKTSNELKKLLYEGKSRVLITTIQKFDNEEVVSLNNSSNLIVFVDNASRTQSGSKAIGMRRAIPNATYIGFSQADNDDVRQIFGACIDKYSMKNAIDDGSGIKLVYERRITKSQRFSLDFKDSDDKFKKLLEDDDRIDEIAKDLLNHYKENVFPGGFKAQIICSSRLACVKYCKALEKNMKEIIGEELEAKVIMSSNISDPSFMYKHFLNKQEQGNAIMRFREPLHNDKLAFLIVTDTLLTDFDAPIQQVIYVDKNLKNNKLAQSIIRITRPYENRKQCGYIVDYDGALNSISEIIDNN